MNEQPPIITTATVVRVAAGDPPALTTRKRAVNSQGIARHITQKVAVRDAALFERLCATVGPGDEIGVTLVTDWAATDYRMSLLDFSTAPCRSADAPAKELAGQTA